MRRFGSRCGAICKVVPLIKSKKGRSWRPILPLCQQQLPQLSPQPQLLLPQPQPQSVVELVVFCVVLWVAFWLALRVLQFWVLFCSLVLRAICGYSFQNQKSNLGPGSTGSANSLPSLAADMQNGG